MPKMDIEEFKFPDEIEEEERQKEEKLEIEIVDDTPEEDRGRAPLPKDIVDKLDKDEMSQYDEEVKQKLLQMKKAYHDERRAKEQALREQEEAIAYAKRLMADNQAVRTVLKDGEKEFVKNMKKAAETSLELATRDYKEAYESGDADAIAKATAKLSKATSKMEKAEKFELPTLQEAEKPVKITTEQERPYVPPADPRAVDWQKSNTWFGQDDEMTAAALGLHQKLVRTGMNIGSDEYYATLDKTMRKRFPEHFGVDESSSQTETKEVTPPKRPANVVAPAVRSTASNKVKLTPRQVALAKKLGLTSEQYALEMKRLEK